MLAHERRLPAHHHGPVELVHQTKELAVPAPAASIALSSVRNALVPQPLVEVSPSLPLEGSANAAAAAARRLGEHRLNASADECVKQPRVAVAHRVRARGVAARVDRVPCGARVEQFERAVCVAARRRVGKLFGQQTIPNVGHPSNERLDKRRLELRGRDGRRRRLAVLPRARFCAHRSRALVGSHLPRVEHLRRRRAVREAPAHVVAEVRDALRVGRQVRKDEPSAE